MTSRIEEMKLIDWAEGFNFRAGIAIGHTPDLAAKAESLVTSELQADLHRSSSLAVQEIHASLHVQVLGQEAHKITSLCIRDTRIAEAFEQRGAPVLASLFRPT